MLELTFPHKVGLRETNRERQYHDDSWETELLVAVGQVQHAQVTQDSGKEKLRHRG